MREIIDAALRRQRNSVLLGLAVGLGLALAAIGARAVGGVVGALTLLPILLFLGLAVREMLRRPGQEGLRLDETAGAFFAPPQATVSFGPMLCGYFAYYAVYTSVGFGADAWRWPLALVYLVLCGALAAGYWRRVPFVALTAEGVSAGAPQTVIVVPWEAIGGGAPVGPGAAGLYLRLPVDRPELIRRSGWWPRRGAFVRVRELAVAPAFLAAAIQHYVAHPEHRSAIGAPEEYGRLQHALAGGRLTGQV